MAFFFRPFPKIFYDVKRNNNNSSVLTNITARYKIRDILKQRAAIFYDYTVKEGDTPSSVAFRYYEDETLDWLILLVNDIIDPYYDWPLSYNTFIEFIKSLYGSVDTAMATTYEYRQILNSQSHLIDGTVIPERTVVVDQNTYNSLAPANRKLIDAYEYYEEQNNLKRNIKLLDKRYLGSILTEVETIFSSS